jgi:hypothetical protein
MIDPTGLLITGVRDTPAVGALVAKRVRAGEADPGDARGPKEYQRFVVFARTGYTRIRRAPVQDIRLVARCYGLTYQDATALAAVVSDSLHEIGPRLATNGIGIYGSFDDGGLGAELDPDTKQPHEDFLVRIVAPTVRVMPIG